MENLRLSRSLSQCASVSDVATKACPWPDPSTIKWWSLLLTAPHLNASHHIISCRSHCLALSHGRACFPRPSFLPSNLNCHLEFPFLRDQTQLHPSLTLEHTLTRPQARRYILDPLTAPEPSQESGIAGSYNAAARPLSDPKTSPDSSSGSSPKKHGFFARRLSFRSRGKQHAESVVAKSPPPPPARSELPTPPASTSPSKAEFHSSNPFSDHAPQASRDATPPANQQKYPPLRSKKHLRVVSDPHYPPGLSSRPHAPRQPPREEAPPPYRRHYSNPSPDPFYQGPLAHRYPGDMSHRPLDSAKRDTRAAERTHRRGASLHNTDVIDALDTIGGTYHHGGPYDATLASRNVNKKYSPLAAVQRSNEEAIRATPREFIQDSLEHHVPLQGVAIIPPGGVDPRGRVMDYEEGADLMREEDAPGGAYKRWAEVVSSPAPNDRLPGID